MKCHAFISECTFGLPVFKWLKDDVIRDEINQWWADNRAQGRTSLLGAYSLGKVQRVLGLLDHDIGPILTHGAVENTNIVMRNQGLTLPDTIHVTPDTDPKQYPGALVLAPPSALG